MRELLDSNRLPEDFLSAIGPARELNTEILRRIGGTQGKTAEFWGAFFGN